MASTLKRDIDYPQWAGSHFHSFMTQNEELKKVIPLMDFFFMKSALAFTDKRMIYAKYTLLKTIVKDIEAPNIKSISLKSEINIFSMILIIVGIIGIIYQGINLILLLRYGFIYMVGVIIIIPISILLIIIGIKFLKISDIFLVTYYKKEFSHYTGTYPPYYHNFVGNSWKLEEAIKYIREWEYLYQKVEDETQGLNHNIVCNQCGNKATYIKEFEKWYCEYCKIGIIKENEDQEIVEAEVLDGMNEKFIIEALLQKSNLDHIR